MNDAPAWHTTDHGADELYMFGTPFGSSALIDGPWQEEDKEMSKTMMKYWTNFAKTGLATTATCITYALPLQLVYITYIGSMNMVD